MRSKTVDQIFVDLGVLNLGGLKKTQNNLAVVLEFLNYWRELFKKQKFEIDGAECVIEANEAYLNGLDDFCKTYLRTSAVKPIDFLYAIPKDRNGQPVACWFTRWLFATDLDDEYIVALQRAYNGDGPDTQKKNDEIIRQTIDGLMKLWNQQWDFEKKHPGWAKERWGEKDPTDRILNLMFRAIDRIIRPHWDYTQDLSGADPEYQGAFRMLCKLLENERYREIHKRGEWKRKNLHGFQAWDSKGEPMFN